MKKFRCKKCNKLLVIRIWGMGVSNLYKLWHLLFVQNLTSQPTSEIKCQCCETINHIPAKFDCQVEISQNERDEITSIFGGSEKHPANINYLKTCLKGFAEENDSSILVHMYGKNGISLKGTMTIGDK